jgi:hypothetical protein
MVSGRTASRQRTGTVMAKRDRPMSMVFDATPMAHRE